MSNQHFNFTIRKHDFLAYFSQIMKNAYDSHWDIIEEQEDWGEFVLWKMRLMKKHLEANRDKDFYRLCDWLDEYRDLDDKTNREIADEYITDDEFYKLLGDIDMKNMVIQFLNKTSFENIAYCVGTVGSDCDIGYHEQSSSYTNSHLPMDFGSNYAEWIIAKTDKGITDFEKRENDPPKTIRSYLSKYYEERCEGALFYRGCGDRNEYDELHLSLSDATNGYWIFRNDDLICNLKMFDEKVVEPTFDDLDAIMNLEGSFYTEYMVEKVVILQRYWKRARYDKTYKLCRDNIDRDIEEMGLILL